MLKRCIGMRHLCQFSKYWQHSDINWDAYWRLGRFDKPIGALLLHLPCVWGTVLGQPSFSLNEVLWLSGGFGVGAFTMRSAGCVVNDMLDRDIDIQVERTRSRPLASGELNMKQACGLLATNLGVGLLVLTQLNVPTIVASFSIVPIAFLYPLAKRYFIYPQLILGIAFNFGVIVGGIQTGGIISPAILCGYAAGIVNTLIYDTIYAHQDVKFDKQLNLYSTAYTMPLNAPKHLTWAFSSLIGFSCYLASYNPIVYPALILFQFAQYRQVTNTDFNSPDSCAEFFRNYKYYQIAVALIYAIGSYLK